MYCFLVGADYFGLINREHFRPKLKEKKILMEIKHNPRLILCVE